MQTIEYRSNGEKMVRFFLAKESLFLRNKKKEKINQLQKE